MSSPQQIKLKPAPVVSTMDRGAAEKQLPMTIVAAVLSLGASVTFRQKLQQSSTDRGFAGFGASCSGTLPVFDGSGVPRMSIQYSSADPRLRQLDAVLTAADGTAVAKFRRLAAPGGMSSMVMVSARSCEVTVGGQPYATIEYAGACNSEARLVRASDERLGARVVDGPGCVCCGAYTVDLSAATSPTTKSPRVMTVDSDPCIPACPACMICSFNLGQRRVCELGDGDPLTRLDLLLLYAFSAVDPLTVVSSG